MRNFLINFLDRFEYPSQAKEALVSCFDAMASDEKAAKVMKEHLDLYASDGAYDHQKMLSDTTEEAIRIGMPWQTAHLVMGILLSEFLKEKYLKKGIDEQFWIDIVNDFKCKLFECHNVYHIWGSFVGHWWKEIFSMNIFGIGRLQYQMKAFGKEYDDGAIHLTPDMKALSIHIPSSGPLTKELREDSYKRAKEFFAFYFGDQVSLFMCSSWLLYPGHEEMIPMSNIVDFMHDFKVFEVMEPEKSNDLWRIFDDAYVLPYNLLPRNNSLRRAYAERLCSGKKVGRGVGFFTI